MILTMMHTYLNDAPPAVRDFLIYNEAVAGKSAATVQEYFLDLQTFLRYMKLERGAVPADTEFEEIKIDDVDNAFLRSITLSDLYGFLIYCKNERGNLAASRARKTTCLRVFFKYLTLKAHILDENPAEQLETPKIKKALPKYLTLDQSEELLAAVDGVYKERDYAILTLFLNCGIRLSELCGLNLSDIRSDGSMRVLGKGNKERTVFLNQACVDAVAAYLRVRPVDGLRGDARNALFVSRLHKRIGTQAVQKMVARYLEKIGLDNQGYSPHKLRHTAATLMYQYGGVDVRVLQEILGHENLNTTQIYTHISSKQMQEAAQSNPLSKKKPPKNS